MTTTEKTCFKCLETKPLSEFYRHSQMGDGHLNKCKVCAKADVAAHREENLDRIRAYDKERSKLKHRIELRNKTFGRSANKDRKDACTKLANAVRDGKVEKSTHCYYCGSTDKIQGHHFDYSRPLDVTWLCLSCHRKTHAMSNYDIRKELRKELQRKRCEDRDHSMERYAADAAWLNDELERLGITDQRKATWGS